MVIYHDTKQTIILNKSWTVIVIKNQHQTQQRLERQQTHLPPITNMNSVPLCEGMVPLPPIYPGEMENRMSPILVSFHFRSIFHFHGLMGERVILQHPRKLTNSSP